MNLETALDLRKEKEPRYWLLLGKMKAIGFLRKDEMREYENLREELAELNKAITDLTR